MRLGSRGSALARWQVEEVRRQLHEIGEEAEIEIFSTSGDQRQDVALAEIGGKGLFTLEIEQALAAGRIDAAVHSLKDVPSQLPGGLCLGAVLKREDPRDVLVAAPGSTLRNLPAGSRVGTSSLRRQAQALALRPDLEYLPIRGNVDTRLRKWRAGEFDALLLAAAGLKRLGHDGAIAEYLDPAQMCPSAGQGVIAVEIRDGDEATAAKVIELRHMPTFAATTAERALLERLECGCQAPVAAYAHTEPGWLRLQAVAASPDGTQIVRHRGVAAIPGGIKAPEVFEVIAEKSAALGRNLAEFLLANGAADILREVKGDARPHSQLDAQLNSQPERLR